MIANVFTYHQGTSPLLITVPHDGRLMSDDMATHMSPAGLKMSDTDWHVARLYGFAKAIGASMLVANYSRYVVDLNRPADDAALYPRQVSTGLCPLQTFAGETIYADGFALRDADKQLRIETYWRPYHNKISATLDALRGRFGRALLWDAHSIASRVPRLFDGVLPELNIGTNDGRSCASDLVEPVCQVADNSAYNAVLDVRFKGGYTTRHYGDPAHDIHAIQLEIAQRAYMDERTGVYDDDKAATLIRTLRAMLEAFQAAT